jgi:hypothetical protein
LAWPIELIGAGLGRFSGKTRLFSLKKCCFGFYLKKKKTLNLIWVDTVVALVIRLGMAYRVNWGWPRPI